MNVASVGRQAGRKVGNRFHFAPNAIGKEITKKQTKNTAEKKNRHENRERTEKLKGIKNYRTMKKNWLENVLDKRVEKSAKQKRGREREKSWCMFVNILKLKPHQVYIKGLTEINFK